MVNGELFKIETCFYNKTLIIGTLASELSEHWLQNYKLKWEVLSLKEGVPTCNTDNEVFGGLFNTQSNTWYNR